MGEFEFPGTEKKVAGKRIYREKSSRNISPECHLEQWKSAFLGPGVKLKFPKSGYPVTEFKFWSELNGPFEAGAKLR